MGHQRTRGPRSSSRGRVLLTQAGRLPSAGLFPSPTNAGITGSCENEAMLHIAGLGPRYTVTFTSPGKVGPGTTSVQLQGQHLPLGQRPCPQWTLIPSRSHLLWGSSSPPETGAPRRPPTLSQPPYPAVCSDRPAGWAGQGVLLCQRTQPRSSGLICTPRLPPPSSGGLVI